MKKFLFILLSAFLVLSFFSCNSNPIKHTITSADSTDNTSSDDNPSDDNPTDNTPSDDKPTDEKPTDDNPTDVPPTDDTSTKYNVLLKIYDKDSLSYIDYDTKEISKLSDLNDDVKVDDVTIGGTTYSFYGWADVSESDDILEEYNNDVLPLDTQIIENKTYCAIYTSDYLTFLCNDRIAIIWFEVVGDGTLQNTISLQYKREGDLMFRNYRWDGNKTTVNTNAIGEEIRFTGGQKIYFKGSNKTFSNANTYVRFKSSGSIMASGNIMSIMRDKTRVPKDCFYLLFRGSPLVTAPKLPATTLSEGCYGYMFLGCLSLETAPKLPAEMLEDSCYSNMFRGCASLTDAPELPATTLAQSCYSSMFSDCTSLTAAPKLPATTLVNSCYYRMFANCSKLNFIECLATDFSASACLYYWVSGVATSGTFKCKSGTSWATGTSGIPEGWRIMYI